jgi:uncharacterized protein
MEKFLVMIERKPTFTGSSIPEHREFLQRLKETDTLLMAGGYSDQTGGAYVIQAASLEAAKNIVITDPMYEENESVYSIKEWNVV